MIFILLVLGGFKTAAQNKWVRVIALQGKWKFSIGDKEQWKDVNFNDKDWETIYVPEKWEDEGFNGYDGHAWYRRTFEGADLGNKEQSFNLMLGYIDDVDEVYLNGHRIGFSGSFPPRYRTAYNALRNYPIPAEYINFSGKNVIAVRVYDAEIEGGIVSGDIGIFTNKDDQGLTVNLRGMWEFKVSAKQYKYNFPFDEKLISVFSQAPTNDWTEINVPDVWENQGFRDFDGSAWYRKKFTIPKSLAGQELVLLLGKIDDSDKTYLNGKLIGSTFDKYDKLRIYTIPAVQVKAGEVNTLLIYVEDPGGYGGIYEGPVGLMRMADFTRYIRWK
jgi:hypothetical protein